MSVQELAKGLEELYGADKVKLFLTSGESGWIQVDLVDTLDISVYYSTKHGWTVGCPTWVRVANLGGVALEVVPTGATLEAVSSTLRTIQLKAHSQRLQDLERLAAELSDEDGG